MQRAFQTHPLGGGSRRRRVPGTLRGWLIGLGIFVVAAVTFVYALARTKPAWYQPLDANSQQVIDAGDVGAHFSDLHNVMERVPLGDQPWSISQWEINSTLATSFAPPMNPDGKRHYPLGGPYPKYSAPFVLFTPGHVTFAVRSTRLPGSGAGGVASVRFSVEVQPAVGDAAPMWLVRVEGVWIGDLRIPQFLVASKIRAYMPELIRAVTQATTLTMPNPAKVEPEIDTVIHAIEEGKAFSLVIPYDRRKVIVKAIHIDGAVMSVVFGPETPGAARSRSGEIPAPPFVMPK